MSNIGDGCNIGDGSVVQHSVVGAGSVLFDDLTLGFAVCYPETFLIHGPYHLSVFGRASAMFATILDDYRLDGKPIRLEMGGKLVAHPFPFMGSFIGHRTRVAGGSIISPGRSIPNDVLVFPSPGSVLSRVGEDLPRGVPLFIQNGGLEQFAPTFSKPAVERVLGEQVDATTSVS
jgi:NDP-sugar pyrophosphorylase family protein